jgi:hypothetical protein
MVLGSVFSPIDTAMISESRFECGTANRRFLFVLTKMGSGLRRNDGCRHPGLDTVIPDSIRDPFSQSKKTPALRPGFDWFFKTKVYLPSP